MFTVTQIADLQSYLGTHFDIKKSRSCESHILGKADQKGILLLSIATNERDYHLVSLISDLTPQEASQSGVDFKKISNEFRFKYWNDLRKFMTHLKSVDSLDDSLDYPL